MQQNYDDYQTNVSYIENDNNAFLSLEMKTFCP